MKTLLVCSLITLLLLVIFYIWGKSFFATLMEETCISDCILFGFAIMHIAFQPYYLLFLLTRESFYTLAIIWVIVATLLTCGMVVYLYCHKVLKILIKYDKKTIICLFINISVVLFLCVFIGCRPRNQGVDTVQYIQRMNEMVYMGNLWVDGDFLQIHQGINSFYSFFAVLSLITGIKPIYVSFFTIRFLGVILASMVAYRYGRLAFGKKGVYALVVSIMVPITMLVWKSQYGVGNFFIQRLNESKAFCQILLFPMAVSIFWEMLQNKRSRNILWLEEVLFGLAAVPIAASSLTIYPVIVFAGGVAVLVYDRMKGWRRTLVFMLISVMPNIMYTLLYVLYRQRLIRF